MLLSITNYVWKIYGGLCVQKEEVVGKTRNTVTVTYIMSSHIYLYMYVSEKLWKIFYHSTE